VSERIWATQSGENLDIREPDTRRVLDDRAGRRCVAVTSVVPAESIDDYHIPYTAEMRTTSVCLMALLLAACGARERVEKSPAAAATPDATGVAEAMTSASEVTDEKIGLPAYPGASEVASSRLKLSLGTGVTYTVSFYSTDSPAKVAAFYRSEASTLGTLEESINLGEDLQTVSIVRADGSRSVVRAAKDGKGQTVIALMRAFPLKEGS